MKVLYIQPGRGIGGAKVSLAHLVRNLAQTQESHVVLSPPEDAEYTQILAEGVKKIHYVYLPGWQKQALTGVKARLGHALFQLKSGWYVKPALQIARIIRNEHIDLVHTNNSISPVGALAAYLSRRPHIWHVREPLGVHGQFQLSPSDSISAWTLDHLSRKIICNSDYTAGFFRQRGIPVQVIMNGIDLEKFSASRGNGLRMREMLQLPNDVPLIGMVGSLGAEWKNHNKFLLAVRWLDKHLPGCRYVIYGGSNNMEASPYTRSLRRMTEDLGISGSVTWAGFITDVPGMMGSLDILVHPTANEGSGRVVMEAMAAGTPVVGVRAGGVSELIEDGITGLLVEDNDEKSLGEAVLKLLNDPVLRSRISQAARQYAFEQFSHERTANEVKTIYQEIIQEQQ